MYQESQSLELRENMDVKAIAKAIAAFANSEGGRVLVGVNDNGEVIGLEIGDNTLEKLAEKLSSRLDPKIYPLIFQKEVDGKQIVEIVIEKSFQAPHFADHIAYKRVGRTSQKMEASEIENVLKKRSAASYDSRVLESATIDDLDLQAVKGFLESRERDYSPEQYLRARNLVTEKDGKLYPTVAGILLFGNSPETYLPNAIVAVIDSTTNESQPNTQFINGNLFSQLKHTLEIIQRAYPIFQSLRPIDTIRQELYRVSPLVLRESVVNALVHRLYENHGNKVIIKLNPNSISITNPATFPADLDVSKLDEYQYSQNPLLSRVMYEKGYVEEIGQGVDRIMEWAAQMNQPREQVFEYKYGVITLNLPLRGKAELISEANKLTSRQQHLLKLLESGQGYSSSELVDELEVSKDTVLSELETLQKVVNIVEEGSGRTTRYRWV